MAAPQKAGGRMAAKGLNIASKRNTIKPGGWLDYPATVQAPSPEDRTVLCDLALSAADSVTMAMIGRRQLILEMWSMIVGIEPPIIGCAHRNRNIKGDLTKL